MESGREGKERKRQRQTEIDRARETDRQTERRETQRNRTRKLYFTRSVV